MQKFRSIDLFAGIGGIRLGFDQAFGKEIETVFVSEWDEFAQKTYKANFHDGFEITISPTSISVLRVSPVRHSVLPGSAKVLRTITRECRAAPSSLTSHVSARKSSRR